MRVVAWRRDRAQTRRATVGLVERRPKEASQTPSLLAPLAVGDELPWKLSREGHPQWLVVIEVMGADRYVVQYPDGFGTKEALQLQTFARSLEVFDEVVRAPLADRPPGLERLRACAPDGSPFWPAAASPGLLLDHHSRRVRRPSRRRSRRRRRRDERLAAPTRE
jgi:hypothetical protein